RDRAVARERGAEMLHLVGARHAIDANEGRDLPVVAREPAHDAAKRAPVVELARSRGDVNEKRRVAVLVEVVAVARRAAGEPGAERRRATFEVRARAAHA